MFDIFKLIIDFFKDIGIICDKIEDASNYNEKLPSVIDPYLDDFPLMSGGACHMWTIPIKIEMDANDLKLEGE